LGFRLDFIVAFPFAAPGGYLGVIR